MQVVIHSAPSNECAKLLSKRQTAKTGSITKKLRETKSQEPNKIQVLNPKPELRTFGAKSEREASEYQINPEIRNQQIRNQQWLWLSAISHEHRIPTAKLIMYKIKKPLYRRLLCCEGKLSVAADMSPTSYCSFSAQH